MTATATPDAAGGLLLPEYVAGRKLWVENAMTQLIHKLHHGDGVKGWEGDPRLGVYWQPAVQRWEVWRLEDDNEMRFVCRSGPGVPFDDRLIDALLAWDRNRRKVSLADEVVEANERREAELEAQRSEWVHEDVGPRLHHAVMQDAGWGRRRIWSG